MPEIFTVEQRGVGRDDYSREIFAGKERAGIALEYNQRFRFLTQRWIAAEPLYPFIVLRNIPAGDKDHLKDSDTLALLPLTIPKGFTLSIIAGGYAASEDMAVWLYFDSYHCFHLGTTAGGATVYENKLQEFTTRWFDAEAESEHTLDIIVYNRGGAPLYGGASVLCIMEAVGTPPWPTVKECVCPYCNQKQTEPVSATKITCKRCGKIYLVTNFASLRELGR